MRIFSQPFPTVRTSQLILLGGTLALAVRGFAAPVIGPWQPLFKGIDHVVATNDTASADFVNLQVAHCLRVDLQDPDIALITTPRISNYQQGIRETGAMTVSRFLQVNHTQVAVNANFFDPGDYYQVENSPIRVSGLAISQGLLVSPQSTSVNASAVMFDAANHPTIIHTNWPAASTAEVYNAISGDYPLVIQGVNIGRRYLGMGGFVHETNPRTAFGVSQDKRYLYLLTIDGRQPGYSNGALDYETGAWFVLLGAYDAVNLDGGGSTTMSYEDSTGKPRRLNKPSAVADSGKERTVGSHFGVYAKPVPGFINDVTSSADDEVATITWTTTAAADSQVEYGLTANLGESSPVQPALVTHHNVLLSGLQPGSGYYFRAVSVLDGTRHVSPIMAFTTTNYFTTNVVMDLTTPWKFATANLDGVNWIGNDYDDSAWTGQGPGLLWVDLRPGGPNPEVQPKATEMPGDGSGFPYPTYYLRGHFPLAAKSPGTSLMFTTFIDDGAVFYLNGHEIYRLRMPEAPTPISNDLVATGFACSGDATCPDEFTVTAPLTDFLVEGDNLLAVEVHNYNLRSPDITFGLTLVDAQRVVTPPQLSIAVLDGQIVLNWDRSGFVLQHNFSPEGEWVDVPGPVVRGPYISDGEGPTRYYRLRR